MQKEFIIKKSPLLKIILNETEFKIINQQYKDEGGIFSYSKLYDIEFLEQSTDYAMTGFTLILSLILPFARSGKMNLRERIRMNYDGKERKIVLLDPNRNTVTKAITEIKKQMAPKYRRD